MFFSAYNTFARRLDFAEFFVGASLVRVRFEGRLAERFLELGVINITRVGRAGQAEERAGGFIVYSSWGRGLAHRAGSLLARRRRAFVQCSDGAAEELALTGGLAP